MLRRVPVLALAKVREREGEMTTGDDSYPSAWTPRGAPQAAPPAAPAEAVAMAIDAYVAALTPENSSKWSGGQEVSEKVRPMTTPEPDDSCPSSWKPRERIERDEAAGIEPLAVEKWLAALDPVS